MFHSDGMNQDDIDEHYRNMAKFENLQRENKKLKKTVFKLKEKLEQTNLHNARLLYTNRVLSTASLNEQQKKRIVDVVKSAGSVEEAKVVYETLQKTMAAGSSNDSRSKSLSETISRPSSVILASRSRDAEPSGPNPTINRWATLAGFPVTIPRRPVRSHFPRRASPSRAKERSRMPSVNVSITDILNSPYS